MAGRRTRFEDTCEITGNKNNTTVVAEILTFRDKDVIIATINRAAEVTLRWQESVELYVGSLANMELRSSGPKVLT